MNDPTRAVGIPELRTASERFARAMRTGVLPLFVATCVVESVLLLGLPGSVDAVVGPMLADPAWGLLELPIAAGLLGLAVVLLHLTDLVRTAVYAPLRRAALDGAHVSTREAFHESVRRVVRVFVIRQIVGLLILFATLLFVLFGTTYATIPYAIVSFVFAPASYLVAARHQSYVEALRNSVTIARNNMLAVFGIQAALLVLAVWLGQFIQSLATTIHAAPLAAAWGVVTVVLVYRLASFCAMSTLFLALDEHGHCD